MAKGFKECAVEGCAQRSATRGWCKTHYSRWQRHGDPLKGGLVQQAKPRPPKPQVECSVRGCNTAARSRGMCNKHYSRWFRTGTTETTKFLDPEEAFAVLPKWQGDCLVWPRVNSSGYGVINVGKGKKKRAHRYAWERVHGDIREDLVVDHACHNITCVNVDHLRVVTQAENMQNRKGARKDSLTGVRGVGFVKKLGKYRATVSFQGERHHLGYFDSIEEAGRAVADKRQELGMLGS